MAYQFRADLRMVLEKLAWAEWRVDLLTGETALMAMVTVTRANLQALHNGFHANCEGNTMITEAKDFGNKVLKGMATSLFASSEAAAEVFGCSNAKPVGDICEALLYFGLIGCRNDVNYIRSHWAARELFWLTRDMLCIFKIGQSYGMHTADSGYHIDDLRRVIQHMQGLERRLHASR